LFLCAGTQLLCGESNAVDCATNDLKPFVYINTKSGAVDVACEPLNAVLKWRDVGPAQRDSLRFQGFIKQFGGQGTPL
jgi:hypothetical protein